MSYSESYINRMEHTTLDAVLDSLNRDDYFRPGCATGIPHHRQIATHIIEHSETPALRVSITEEAVPVLQQLLTTATTPEERLLIRLIDKLVDRAWQFATGKALRGELRRNFIECGLSARQYYKAFHAIESKVKS